MGYTDLRQFIQDLEKAGELTRITAPVSAHLELAEITDRVSKMPGQANKALLFENVQGYDMPVLINAFGSHKRMCMSLEVDDLNSIADRIRRFIKPQVPENFIEKLAFLPTLMELAKFPPKLTHGQAPCQEVVITNPSEAMLDKLPILTCWPDDGGPFITMGAVITKDPKNGNRNVGMYRLQKFDNNTTGMHWHKHHDGARNFEETRRMAMEAAEDSNGPDSAGSQPSEPPNYGTFFEKDAYEKPGNRLEVAVVLGADPAVTYSATAPLPPEIDELLFAGFLRQSPVRLTKCKTIDLEVPANAEIVIEGYVDQKELRREGPFGDHTGFYSLAGLFPIFHVTAVTHRKNPIYQTTIVGKPPQEDCYLGKATERIFMPMVQMLVPEIVDMNLPWEGVFHNCVIVSIDKRYPGHAKKVMSSFWGLGQLMFTKFAIILDKDINVHDLSEVALNVFGNTDPRRDMMFVDGPLDILDHASPLMGYGSKVGIDATRKWQSEGFQREWPTPIVMSREIKDLVDSRWASYGLSGPNGMAGLDLTTSGRAKK
ncbi:MAG: UbiD family decarboxylase [Cyanobacteria bacterium SZAS LIN-3]|nr:UbiD family decarboxylase [Cyanobacteria bacterium SZAS LIN-3]MBS2006881.1 UbiD family decarboxylase [Cyanobacteria bacterium SZAS TMP-1]